MCDALQEHTEELEALMPIGEQWDEWDGGLVFLA